MREPHQIAVARRRIDHDEVVAVLDRHDRGGEAGEFRRFVLVDAARIRPVDDVMIGQFERNAGFLRPAFAIEDVAGEAFLAAVDVDGGDALARLSRAP